MNSMLKNVETIYPLSPLQQGMLYHSELEPSSGVYIEQFIFELTGSLNHDDFRHAWSEIIKRHAVFRTQFTNLDQEKPRQIVLKQVELPWQEEDWQDLPSNGQAERLNTLLAEDRIKGFAANQAPLMRVCFIQLEPEKYQFIWTHHHAIVDGWSWPIIFKELFIIYKAISQDRNLDLPRALPYRNYIHWLGQQDQEQAEKYWRQYLQGFSTPTPLMMKSSDKSNATNPSALPQTKQLVIDDKVANKINALVRKEKITLNVLMQAVWALLLSRYSGEKDIAFGKVVSGRPPDLEGAASIVGAFINTLPLRVNVNPETQILPWLQQLHQSQIEQIQYQTTPLFNIQRWSEVSGGTNLFNSLFVFENYPIDTDLDGLTAETELKITDFYAHEQTNFPLTILVVPCKEITVQINYECSLFDDASVERLLSHYVNLLEEIAQNPKQKLCDISLLSDQEKESLLSEWNKTEVPYPRNKYIHHVFEAQVKKSPNAVALIFGDQQLTYKELNKKSNQLAHYLIKQGVGPEARVGLCMERSFEMIIGILGILKAGGAYVPLDPDYPIERLGYMIEDSGLSLVLTQDRLLEKLSILFNKNTQTIVLDHQWPAIKTAKATQPVLKHSVQAEHLAYVIYTSGSTGKPKGVMVNHENILNTLYFLEQKYPVNKDDAYLLKTNYVFDVSISELFGWFMGSGRLVILPPEAEKFPDIIIDHIERHGVTHLNFAPSMLSVFVEEARQNQPFIDQCPLEYLMVAGEAFPKPLVKTCVELFGSTAVENIYGPTETSIYGAWYSCPKEQIESEHTPIGKPVSNTQLYVLDQYLQPLPIGIPGELCIAGAGLARGYLNQPELTAAAFIDNPFNPGSKLYKTGDLVRYLADGNIEYIGRVDHQVKMRGFRIELGEIENTLTEQEGIREAIVLAHSSGESEGNHYLAAYIVCDQELSIDQSLLRDNLKSSLPDYMVPSFFVELDKLPLTPNGKVDRKALPVPDADALHTQEYVAPRTESEKELANIWASILNLPANKIGVHDNFFELSGHSLLATRVVSRIRSTFSIEIQVRELFALTSIEALAEKIDQQQHQRQLTTSLVNKDEISDMADTEEVRI